MSEHPSPDESWKSYRRTMRHEMRTPLGHIVSYAELVLDELTDHDVADAATAMHAIYVAGKQATVLVDGAFEAPRIPGQHGPDPALAELTGLMEVIADHVEQVRAMPAMAGSPDLTRDLDRIGSAARRLQTLVEEAAKPTRT
jgi:signal transduction histidine kinase